MPTIREPQRVSSAALVARSHELGVLVEAISSPPAVVVVEGEAGVGKSRLVAESLAPARARGLRERCGRSHDLRDPAPLLPVVEALRDAGPVLPRSLSPVTGALRVLLPELADRLPPAPKPLEDPRAERHQVMRALRELLAATGPTVLVLEDLHWADETTVEFLRYLVTEPPATLSLVATCRVDGPAADSPLAGLLARVPAPVAHARLHLPPLEPAAVGVLAGEILGGAPVGPEFATWLHDSTGGVPFAVEELLALLRERQELVYRDGAWTRGSLERIVVPDAIRDAILERVGNLSAGARRLVLAAAVLARPVDDRVLAQVGGFGDLDHTDTLTEAERSGLLHEPAAGLVELRHALARQAVDDAIPPPDRRRLHLRAARALSDRRGTPAADLARHFREAGAVEEWAHYGETAAEEAIAVFDEATACRLLDPLTSLDVLPVERRVRLAERYCHAAVVVGCNAAAVAAVRRVAQDVDLDAAAWFAFAATLFEAGEVEEAHGALERCLALSPPADIRVMAMCALGIPLFGSDDVTSHRRRLDEAWAAVNEGGSPVTRMEVLANRAGGLLCLGEPGAWDAVAELRRPAATVGERRQRVRGFVNLAESALYVGHYAVARDFVAEARRSAAELGHARHELELELTTVLLDLASGCWREARAAARGGSAYPNRLVVAVTAMLLAADGGPGGEVVELARVVPAAASLWLRSFASGWGARALVATGSWADGLALTAPVVDVFRAKRLWVWGHEVVPPAVRALVALDRVAEAAGLVDELRAGLAGRDAPAAIAALAVCAGTVAEARGDLVGAASSYGDGRAAWADAGVPYEAALAAERLGSVWLCAGDVRAAEVLGDAVRGLDAVGAAHDLARIRQLMRSAGIPAVATHRRGRRGYGVELSPREGEVVRLAAAGRTTREIAAALHLSPRTVDNHVARAMRKQAVASRGELVAERAADFLE